MLPLILVAALITASDRAVVLDDGARLHRSDALYVWEPASRPSRVVIYVHGYYDRVDAVISDHRLIAQLAASGLDATVIIPEAPISGREPVLWPRLDRLLAAAEQLVGRPLDARSIAAIGHSGAVRTLRAWTTDPRLHTVVLLDAMYGDPRPFGAWLARSERHHLHIVSRATEAQAQAFLRTVAGPLGEGRVVHERTRASHMGIVTEGQILPRILAAL